jgi:hypothetical protein
MLELLLWLVEVFPGAVPLDKGAVPVAAGAGPVAVGVVPLAAGANAVTFGSPVKAGATSVDVRIFLVAFHFTAGAVHIAA